MARGSRRDAGATKSDTKLRKTETENLSTQKRTFYCTHAVGKSSGKVNLGFCNLPQVLQFRLPSGLGPPCHIYKILQNGQGNVFYSKLFTCPFHSLHFSFGFQRLPSRHSWPIDLLDPSFHSLPSYDLLCSCALPTFLDVFRLPYLSWSFTASFSPAPSIAYIFHLGFNVYLPGILGLLICLVLAFTRYQAMIYYAAVRYPAFLDVLRLTTLHFMVFYSKLFTCPFHSLHFSIGFQRLPSRQSGPIDSLGPSFHSLPSYDLLRSCALPSVLRCF